MIRPDGTVSDAILSTLTEAQRVPSIGHQLTLTAEPRIVAARCACWTTGWCDANGPHPAPVSAKPVPLNLWDTSADSIPDGWVR